MTLQLRLKLFAATSLKSVVFLFVGIVTALCAVAPEAWAAASPTTTTLAVTVGGGAVTTVTSGSVVTLTATVMAGTTPVTAGTVNFCDAAAKSCSDIHLIGTAQLTKAGTAIVKFRPGIGSHSYKAEFAGTKSNAASTSGKAALTVTHAGLYPTGTNIAQSGGQDKYTLTATVAGNGGKLPTGTVSFVDTSNGNAVLRTAKLETQPAGVSFFNSQNSAVGFAPSAIAVADFNGDGIPDLVVANSGLVSDSGTVYGSVMVLLGNGDGTLGESLTTQGNWIDANAIAVGDFNGDGIPDLAVTSANTSWSGCGCEQETTTYMVTILLGYGDGTFRQMPKNPWTEEDQWPGSIVAGDFNGDGILDLAVANSFTSSVTVLLGNGDGTFTAAASPATGGGALNLVVGDFNRDGIPDLAVAAGGGVTILLGNGDGTFSASQKNLPSSDGGGFIAVGDFNGDGILDLAVEAGPGVVMLLGNGDGTFKVGPSSPAPDLGPYGIATGDFNGDGKLDLAVQAGPGVVVLLGNGDGTFTAAAGSPAITAPCRLSDIAAGDLNGDGVSDLAAMNSCYSYVYSSSVTVLLSGAKTATTAATAVTVPFDSGTHQVVAKYSGDSNYAPSTSAPTSFTAESGTATVTLTASANPVNYGAPVTFTASVTGNLAAAPTGTVTFLDKGKQHHVETLTSSGVVTFETHALALGAHSFTATYSGDAVYLPATSQVLTETVVAAPTTTTTLAVTSAGQPVTTISSGSVVTLTATVQAPGELLTQGQVKFCDAAEALHCSDIHLLGTAQLTQAGTASIKFRPGVGSHSYAAVFAGTYSHALSISPTAELKVTHSGLYPTATRITRIWNASTGNYALTAWVGSDGSSLPTGTVTFLDTSNGNAVLGAASLGAATAGPSFVNSSNPAVGVSPEGIAVGDFNGDGIPDLAVANESDGTVTVLLGNGDGTFTPTAANPPAGDGPYLIATGDFNGDGILDLAIAGGYSDSKLTVLLGNGDGTFKPAASIPAALVSSITGGDFNGDGIADLAVVSGYYGTLNVFLGNGDGTLTAAPPSPALSVNPMSIVAGDFNRDGVLDLAVTGAKAYAISGSVTVLLGNGDGTFAATTSPNTGEGWYPGAITAGDFNGDGIPDLAVTNYTLVFNPSGGWSTVERPVTVLLGNGDGTFTAVAKNPVTGSGTIAVGDFNGDGIPDLAVAEGKDVRVLLGKGNGTFTVAAAPAVGPGSGAMALRDFNGDGVSDLAVSSNRSNFVTVLLTEPRTATATVSGIAFKPTSGTHQVVASYGGDSTNKPSISGPVSLTPPTPTVNTTVAPTLFTLGSAATLTATVKGDINGVAPTGNVSFSTANKKLLGMAALNASGVATLTTSAWTVGEHGIIANYPGDGNYAPAVAPIVFVTVTGDAKATVQLSSSNACNCPGQRGCYCQLSYYFAAAVTGSKGTPTGTAILLDGTSSWGGATLSGTGAIEWDFDNLAAGTFTLTAFYQGDNTYAPATSAPVTITVYPYTPPDGQPANNRSIRPVGDNWSLRLPSPLQRPIFVGRDRRPCEPALALREAHVSPPAHL